MSPSIEHLAQVRRTVLETELSLERYLHATGHRSVADRTLETDRTRVKEATRAYLSLPPVPGEEPLRLDVQSTWIEFDRWVQQARDMAASPRSATEAATLRDDVVVARQRLLEAYALRCARTAPA